MARKEDRYIIREMLFLGLLDYYLRESEHVLVVKISRPPFRIIRSFQSWFWLIYKVFSCSHFEIGVKPVWSAALSNMQA